MSQIVTLEESEPRPQTGSFGLPRPTLAKLIPDARIQAEAQIILKDADEPVADIIHRHSHDAHIVFLGLMEPEPVPTKNRESRL